MKIAGKENIYIADLIETDFDSVEYRVIKQDLTTQIDWTNATDTGDGVYLALVTLNSGNYIIEWRAIKGSETQIIKEEIIVSEDFISKINEIFKVETGTWRIEENQMRFFDEGDNLIYSFDLLNNSDEPTSINPTQRVRV